MFGYILKTVSMIKAGKDEFWLEVQGYSHVMYFLTPYIAKWTIPTVTGDIPPPTCKFLFIQLSNGQAVMFGGETPGFIHSEELYFATVDRDRLVHVYVRTGGSCHLTDAMKCLVLPVRQLWKLVVLGVVIGGGLVFEWPLAKFHFSAHSTVSSAALAETSLTRARWTRTKVGPCSHFLHTITTGQSPFGSGRPWEWGQLDLWGYDQNMEEGECCK